MGTTSLQTMKSIFTILLIASSLQLFANVQAQDCGSLFDSFAGTVGLDGHSLRVCPKNINSKRERVFDKVSKYAPKCADWVTEWKANCPAAASRRMQDCFGLYLVNAARHGLDNARAGYDNAYVCQADVVTKRDSILDSLPATCSGWAATFKTGQNARCPTPAPAAGDDAKAERRRRRRNQNCKDLFISFAGTVGLDGRSATECPSVVNRKRDRVFKKVTDQASKCENWVADWKANCPSGTEEASADARRRRRMSMK